MGAAPALLALSLVLANTAARVAAQQQDVWNVSTGQELADAARRALEERAPQLVVLRANVSLANATFVGNNGSDPSSVRNASLSLAGGSLSFEGSVDTGTPVATPRPATLLDAALRTNLLPALPTPLDLAVRNLAISNLCSEIIAADDGGGGVGSVGYDYISASDVRLFRNDTANLTQTLENVVLYVPEAELHALMYWTILQQSNFSNLRSVIPALLGPAQEYESVVSNMSRHGISFTWHARPALVAADLEVHSLADPSLSLPAQLPPTFCNGTQLSGRQLAADLDRFPLWVASDSDTLQSSLSSAGLYTQNKEAQDPLPIILLSGNMVVGGEAGEYAPVTLRAECMLRGATMTTDGSNGTRQVTLRMGRLPNSLQLAVRGKLYISNMILSPLVTYFLGSQSPDPSGAGYVTALPLWGVNMVSRTTPQVFMEDTTLVLPQEDYAALLAAALRQARWKQGAVSTRALLNGIDVFQLDAGSNASLSRSTKAFTLSRYQGWGVSATQLTVTSEFPLPADYPLPDVDGSINGGSRGSGGGGGSTNKLALGVGLGVGGGGALVALLGLGLWWTSRKRSQRSAAAAAAARAASQARPKSDVEMGGGGGGAKATQNGEHAQDSDDSSPQGGGGTGAPGSVASSRPRSHSVATSYGRQGGAPSGSPLQAGVSGERAASGMRGGGQDDQQQQQLNVLALHAAVKAMKTAASEGAARAAENAAAARAGAGASDGTPTRGGVSDVGAGSAATRSGTSGADGDNGALPDPKKAVQQAVGALGSMDADKLTLLGVLGRGTWGTVYKGQWRNLDVAVKTVLFSNRTDGKGSLPHERAIMEAAVCTSVAHTNVVATYHYDIKPVVPLEEGTGGLQVALSDSNMDLLTTEWKLYLVQEWCNTSMGAAMRSGLLHEGTKRGPLMDLILCLLLDTAQGMEYLHDKNIIHGDLKPENIMLKMDPAAPIGVVAKITDFGLSTTLAPQATHVSNFNSGTPFYVAPEVVAEGRVTKASDLYSLGVVMWELYNCATPWVREKDGAYNLHPRFNTYPPGAPATYMHLAQRCVQRDPRQRPVLPQVLASLRAMKAAWLDGWDSLEVGVGARVLRLPTQPSLVPGLAQDGTGNPPSPPPAVMQAHDALAAGGGNSSAGPAPPPDAAPQRGDEDASRDLQRSGLSDQPAGDEHAPPGHPQGAAELGATPAHGPLSRAGPAAEAGGHHGSDGSTAGEECGQPHTPAQADVSSGQGG